MSYVIGLSGSDDGPRIWHYFDNYEHFAVGKPSERIRYFVINGRWTSTVYKNGKCLCNDRLVRGGPLFVQVLREVKSGQDYNDAINAVSGS